MVDVIISLEATCDLSNDLLKKYDLNTIDMTYIINAKEYSSCDSDVNFLYSLMKENAKVSTSKINEENYYLYFKKLLENNKPIIHLAFSSGLSNTYEEALKAAKRLNEETNSNIIVIDSLCACSGQGFLGILTRIKANEAKDISEIVNYIVNTRMQLNHSFTVDDLRYLANGGRIKKESAKIGNILTIKPVMKMDDKGKLAINNLVISRKRSLITLANQAISNNIGNIFFISHADCLEDANFVASIIKNKVNIEPIITNLGPIIGSHSGPGTLAIYYLANKR